MPRGDGTGSRGQGSGGGRGMRPRGGGGGNRWGNAASPGGECVCPNCGQKVAHQFGQPCLEQKCPKCGASMTRS